MENLKNGLYVGDITKITQEEKLKYAKMFAEGCKELEDLMMKMWDMGIRTYASCAGHQYVCGDHVNTRLPYISFDIKKLSENQQKKLLSFLLKNKEDVFEFTFQIDNLEKERHVLCLHLRNAEKGFKYLSELLDVVNNNKIDFKEDSLSSKEKYLIDSIIDLNAIELVKYLKGVKDLPREKKISFVEFVVEKDKKISLIVKDCVKSHIERKDDPEFGSYLYVVVEGYYTQDPYRDGIYYTRVKGKTKILKKSQLGDLKEFKSNRELNYAVNFTKKQFEKVFNLLQNKNILLV